MDTKPVVETLAAIPVGTIVAWGMVICGIVAAIVAGIVKLYKTFEKYRKYKEEDEEQKATLKRHDEILCDIQNSLHRIEDNYRTDHDVQKRRLKHDITECCNDALREGKIRLSTLRSIEEMFEDYKHVYEGNSWVHTLVEKIEQLPIDRDIDEEE